MPHGCRCTRTTLGAPPTPRFGVSEAKSQTPGAKMRRGNEEVCVLEIVRPGMEDSESVEKQENTGIGPRVPDAVQRERQRSGAPLIRDRHRLKRSRVCSASLRAALRPGHERRAAHLGETNPTNPARVVPAKAGTHDHRRWLWVPALPSLSRGSAGTTNRLSEAPTCGCAKWRPGRFHCCGIVIYNESCNSNVSGQIGRAHV